MDLTLVLAADSDSGEKDDGLTNDTTPTLTGKAEAGSSVRILADGDLLGTVVTNENGVFSYTVANADALDDGSTSFSAVALDEAGNTSKTSKELDITIDGSAPTPTAQTGTVGPDNLMGGATSDTLLGGGGDDVVMGLAGDDVVQGNRGNDLLFGNLGNDTLFGGQDADTVFGGQNDDVAQGNLGNDLVQGNLGNDTLYGGQGADLVFGGQGNDVLYGDLGNDVLSGDLGNDVLIGGAGADRYVFGANSGNDAVFGFSQADGDRLDLQGQTYTFGTAADGSGSALLVLSGGGTIELAGLTQGQVNASFFA